MELPRVGDHRYTVHRNDDGSVFILMLNQPPGVPSTPRFAKRYDLPGQFRSLIEAQPAALQALEKLERGELSFTQERMKKRVRDYELLASAEFTTASHRWIPGLVIKSLKPDNKGATQELRDEPPYVARNAFDTPSAAAKHALQLGERMVLGLIGGLRIQAEA